MVFYGNGIVWDKENNKPLCKFTNGKFETGDARIISLLRLGKYSEEESCPVTDAFLFKCHCGFVAKNLSGLRAHERRHTK